MIWARPGPAVMWPSLGADVVLDSGADDVRAALAEATGGRGVDVAFEAAGNDAAVALAVAAARPGGRVVLAGIPGQDTTTFPASEARRKGLTLKLSRRMKEMYPRATRLPATGSASRSSCRRTREHRGRAGRRGRLLDDRGQGGHSRRGGPRRRAGRAPPAHAAAPAGLARAGR